MRDLLASGIAVAMTIASIAPAAAANLEPKEIQALFFTGQPFMSATPANVKYKMTFSSDGHVVREPVGKSGVKGEGSWTLNKNGFCTTWKGSPPNCFRLVADGANRWSVLKGNSIVGTWSK
jgi:hypothetical protein